MAERTRVLDLASPDFYAIPRASTVEQAVDAIRAAPDRHPHRGIGPHSGPARVTMSS
jgi:hypothetical protein